MLEQMTAKIQDYIMENAKIIMGYYYPNIPLQIYVLIMAIIGMVILILV